jgi:hypothetical protein
MALASQQQVLASLKRCPFPICCIAFINSFAYQRTVSWHPVPTPTSILSADAIRTWSTRSLSVAEQASSRVHSNSVDRCRPPGTGCRDDSIDIIKETQTDRIDPPEGEPRGRRFLFDICTRANASQSYRSLRRRPQRSLLSHRSNMGLYCQKDRSVASLLLILVTFQTALAALATVPAAMLDSFHTISVVVIVGIRAENLLVRLALYLTSLDLRHNF